MVAAAKFKIVAYKFVQDRKASQQDIFSVQNDINHLVHASLMRPPLLLWDNINIHGGNEVEALIELEGWEVWPQPRGSADMHPLDYADFKQLKKQCKLTKDCSVEAAMQLVSDTIVKVNDEGSFQGVVRLPAVWEAVVRTGGLSAVP